MFWAALSTRQLCLLSKNMQSHFFWVGKTKWLFCKALEAEDKLVIHNSREPGLRLGPDLLKYLSLCHLLHHKHWRTTNRISAHWVKVELIEWDMYQDKNLNLIEKFVSCFVPTFKKPVKLPRTFKASKWSWGSQLQPNDLIPRTMEIFSGTLSLEMTKGIEPRSPRCKSPELHPHCSFGRHA